MDPKSLVDRVQHFSDLELATLLSLVSKQHCIVECEDDQVDDVAQELALIAAGVFGLSCAVVTCNDTTTHEDFGSAIIDDQSDFLGANEQSYRGRGSFMLERPARIGNVQMKAANTAALAGDGSLNPEVPTVARAWSLAPTTDLDLDTRKTVSVVIAKKFNLSQEPAQIAGLELIRRLRIFSRTNVHPAPQNFLFIPIIASSTRHIRLNKHLNDRIAMYHYHDPEEGFPNLEEIENGAGLFRKNTSSSSVIHPGYAQQKSPTSLLEHRFGMENIEKLQKLAAQVKISPEIKKYLHDIIVFLRIERGVASGISPYATVLFEALAKSLAPLHGIDYVTPSLVQLACRKIYPHRIMLAAPEKERSMQYGSDLKAVQLLMEDTTPETIIEAVLNTVQCPL